jgi:hypothetical protein
MLSKVPTPNPSLLINIGLGKRRAFLGHAKRRIDGGNMIRMNLALVSLTALTLASPLPAQMLERVKPDNGQVGTVLRAYGMDLGKQKIDSVYLSDQTFDMMVKVLNQTDQFIEFRIPPFVKPGKLQLVLKTAGKEPVMLEQPVYIKVIDRRPSGETIAASK